MAVADNNAVVFPAILADGVVIVGILLVWAIPAGIGVGISNVGEPGTILVPIGELIRDLFVVVGLANVLVYVIARGIDRSGG